MPSSSSNHTSESSTRKHRLMLFSSVHTKAESVKMMQGDNGVSRIDVLFNMSLIQQTQNFDTNNSIVSFCNFIGCFPTSDSMPKSLYVLPALARYTGGFLYEYWRHCSLVLFVTFHHEAFLEECGSLFASSPWKDLVYPRIQFCVNCTWITSFTGSYTHVILWSFYQHAMTQELWIMICNQLLRRCTT